MAEVAASIVGLAAFGAQCANGVIELKQLLQSIKDAPREVTRLLDDITLLQQILQDLERRHNAFAFFSPPDAIWEATRRQCETAAEDVKDVCAELLGMIRSNRIRGSIRATFKKDMVTRHQERLNSIKLDLLLAQSAYGDARMSAFMQQANFHGIIPATHYLRSSPLDESHPSAVISNSLGGPPATFKSNSRSTAVTKCSHTEDISRRDKSQYERMRERDGQTTEYIVGGRWIGMVFKVRIHKAYYDWGLNVTRYNVRTLNSEVFKVVGDGDVAGLQRLLNSHQASIHDVDPNGNGLLEVSLCHQSSVVC